MKPTLMAVAAILLIAAPSLAQTNPCVTPTANAILPPTGVHRFFAELPEQNVLRDDGTPLVVAYQYAAWPDGVKDINAVPPTQGPSTVPKTAFVAVAGFSNCYELTGGLPGLIPQSTRMVASLRAQAQAGAPEPFSAWGDPSNPFSLASPPLTPAKPGRGRIQP